MQHIITTVGKWGVRTESGPGRLATPRPGDVVDFGKGQEYPFDTTCYGRIERAGTDTVSICCSGGSVFLMETGEVSISGGPFATVRLDQLEPTLDLTVVGFWNWGDNRPGPGQGVHYCIFRPVFRLRLEEESEPC